MRKKNSVYILVVVTAVVIAWFGVVTVLHLSTFLGNFRWVSEKGPLRICFSGQMRWVLARAWNDDDVWSRDSDFTAGGRKSWFRHQDVHPQGQSGKDKDGVGRLGLSLENKLLSNYKNETIGTDPLALFHFHRAVYIRSHVLCQRVISLCFHLISTW